MSKIKSFIKQFVAPVKGDDVEVKAQKTLRQATSIVNSQISFLEADLVDLEDKVEQAKEQEAFALINKGELITDKKNYLDNLVEADNNVTTAQEKLEEKKTLLEFFKKKAEQLDKYEDA